MDSITLEITYEIMDNLTSSEITTLATSANIAQAIKSYLATHDISLTIAQIKNHCLVSLVEIEYQGIMGTIKENMTVDCAWL